jgi:proteasome lid subunit RPN8/RPN11
MTESRIRLSAPELSTPLQARIPLAHACRWRSQYENDDLRPGVGVFMTQRAYIRCCAHAATDLNNEVGGGLAGKRRVDPDTEMQFIVIEAVLPARHVRNGSTYLTFTQDTLVAMHEDLEERYQGKELLGWYHTHPRMGVFLSGYDTWLHDHFFPESWQVALVIEPHMAVGGFFIRQPGGRLDPRQNFGFYELMPPGRGSVVYWSNLLPEEVVVEK